MKKPDYKNYDSLGDYAIALEKFNNYKAEKEREEQEEKEKNTIKQAAADIRRRYPRAISMLKKDGLQWAVVINDDQPYFKVFYKTDQPVLSMPLRAEYIEFDGQDRDYGFPLEHISGSLPEESLVRELTGKLAKVIFSRNETF